jgi:hypothetical protein
LCKKKPEHSGLRLQRQHSGPVLRLSQGDRLRIAIYEIGAQSAGKPRVYTVE